MSPRGLAQPYVRIGNGEAAVRCRILRIQPQPHRASRASRIIRKRQPEDGSMKVSGWSRTLVIVGLAGMVIGALDPLEGSLVILPGTGLIAIGALLGRSRHRILLYWSFALVTVGVATMWGLSALGGIGGDSGRSTWWGLVLSPYPVGWIAGLIGATRILRKGSQGSLPPTEQ
jgi:hypothetical protein